MIHFLLLTVSVILFTYDDIDSSITIIMISEIIIRIKQTKKEDTFQLGKQY